MGWETVEKCATGRHGASNLCSASLTYKQIVLRLAERLVGEASLAVGMTMRVERGTGPHEGKVRLVRDPAGFKLTKPPACATASLIIAFPRFPGIATEKAKATAVRDEFSAYDGSIAIDLPSWARATAAQSLPGGASLTSGTVARRPDPPAPALLDTGRGAKLPARLGGTRPVL